MHSVDNMRRLVVRGLELALAGAVDVVEEGGASAPTPSALGTMVEVDEAVLLEPSVPRVTVAGGLTASAPVVDAVFTLRLRQYGTERAEDVEALMLWAHQRNFADALASVQAEDADFVRPTFQRTEVAGAAMGVREPGDSAYLSVVEMRVIGLVLGTVNDRSARETRHPLRNLILTVSGETVTISQ